MTSSTAPLSEPDRSASSRASVSTISPRATFTRYAPGRIRANIERSIRFRVFEANGSATTTTSACAAAIATRDTG